MCLARRNVRGKGMIRQSLEEALTRAVYLEVQVERAAVIGAIRNLGVTSSLPVVGVDFAL